VITAQFRSDNGDRADAPNIIVTIAETNPIDLNNLQRLLSDIKAGQMYGTFSLFAVGFVSGINEDYVRLLSYSGQRDVDYFVANDLNSYNTELLTNRLQTRACYSSGQTNLYCLDTWEAGKVCFCQHAECDIRPVNSTQCTNINECESSNNAGCSQGCTDSEGSYYCYCFKGYTFYDDHTCVDKNECASNNPCQSDETCVNSVGGYYCLQSTVVRQSSALTVGEIEGDDDAADDDDNEGEDIDDAEDEDEEVYPIRLTGGPAAAAVGLSSTNIILSVGVSALGGGMLILILILFIRNFNRKKSAPQKTEVGVSNEAYHIEDAWEAPAPELSSFADESSVHY